MCLTINIKTLIFCDNESEVYILEMKGLTKAVTILAKILEVTSWVGTAFVTLSLIIIALGNNVTRAGRNVLLNLFSSVQSETELSIGGFSIDMNSVDPTQVGRAYVAFFVMALISLILMAVVFRYTYLIFKTAQGKTKFSKGSTPFQPEIVKMIRRIGILTLSVPVLQLIMSIIARLILTGHESEIAVSLDLSSVFFGLVVLCLSQFFAYGAELQEDTDGLL